ncbi:hypothetical protein C1H46_044399 [Malus baccata]|uniref:Uncharacterized protein n=1 Tax=Malus baccata TaxID=106549 RepID=A0A540K780_MALBA|nr:hypothetical protein C1H46_044399 [Malus baccata]
MDPWSGFSMISSREIEMSMKYEMSVGVIGLERGEIGKKTIKKMGRRGGCQTRDGGDDVLGDEDDD